MAVPTFGELIDEQRRMRRLRFIVDFTAAVLQQSSMSRTEGEALVAAARERVLELFPGTEGTFEIVYARRFARLIETFTH
jgi:hypothetical protein